MKYVDNLLECDPNEIQHFFEKRSNITHIIATKNPSSEYKTVIVIWENGDLGTYSLDGRAVPAGSQCFSYRSKKVKRLKPLHVILSEHTYQYDRMRLWIGVKYNDGITYFKDYRAEVLWENRGMQIQNFVEGIYPASFFEEVEE